MGGSSGTNWDIYGPPQETNASHAPAPPVAPSKTAAPKSDTTNWDIYGPQKQAAPAGSAQQTNWDIYGPPKQEKPQQQEEQPGFLTRSLAGGAGEGYDKLVSKLQGVLPESMRGAYATQFATEVLRQGGRGMVDFMTSPVGLGLIAAHLVPVTAPFAAIGDLALGGQQALRSIPDAIDAFRNIHDPAKAARVVVDLAGAYAGMKGGARVGDALRQMPADITAGKPMVAAYTDAFKRTSPPPVAPPSLRDRLAGAEPEDRPGIVAEAEKPTNVRAALEQKIYRKPGARAAANVLLPRVKQPPILDLGQTLVNEYTGLIAKEENVARRVRDQIERTVPVEEQNVRQMGFAMEGDLPESQLSPQARAGLEQIRELNRSRDAMHKEAGIEDESLREPETYIRHYWDFTPPGGNEAATYPVSSRMMRDPSLQARKIGTLKLGMTPVEEGGYGLTPKYENVGDIVYRRHMEAVRTIANQKFANTLRDYGLIADPTKANMRELQWPSAANAPALRKAVFGGKTPEGDVVLREKAPLVHPDIQMAVSSIFDEPFRGPAWGAVNQLRAFSKQLAVGFSLFHNNALSEVTQAEGAGAGGLKAIPRAAKAVAWPLDPEFLKGVRNSIWELRGKVAPEAPPDIRLSRSAVEPWLNANLTFKSSESESAAIRSAMDFLKDRGPILKTLGSPIRAVGKMQYVFNRSLFDYYLPGQMFHSAEHLYAAEMNRLGPNPSPAAEFALRREIADHINRAYGADNLQRLMLTPKAQQALGLTLFAPMWTLSNLRVLGKGFESTTGARITSRYIGGAALTYFLTSQLANYALSSWYGDPQRHPEGGGEYWDDATQQTKRGGHWTWQNPGDPIKLGGRYVPGGTDNWANIYFGQNPDGSARYIRLGKAFREPFMWMTDPLKTLGGKLSLPLRQVFVQLTKHDPGSGYPVINDKLTPEQQHEQRMGALAEMATPFSAQTVLQRIERSIDPNVFREPTSTQFVGLPSRKGASFYQSVADLREALASGREDMAAQVLRNAALNGISPKSVNREVISRMRSEARTAAGIPKPTAEPPQPPTNWDIYGPPVK